MPYCFSTFVRVAYTNPSRWEPFTSTRLPLASSLNALLPKNRVRVALHDPAADVERNAAIVPVNRDTSPWMLSPVSVFVFWIFTSRATQHAAYRVALDVHAVAQHQVRERAGAVVAPAERRGGACVLTIRPATTDSHPRESVGGSDSTRPSSCSSPPLLRRSESIAAVAPFTFTVMVTSWPVCKALSVIVAFTPGPVNRRTTLPEGTFVSVNVPSPVDVHGDVRPDDGDASAGRHRHAGDGRGARAPGDPAPPWRERDQAAVHGDARAQPTDRWAGVATGRSAQRRQNQQCQNRKMTSHGSSCTERQKWDAGKEQGAFHPVGTRVFRPLSA